MAAHAARARHHMTPLMPVPLDPDCFPRATDVELGPDRPPRTAGLLIGGNAGTFRYQPHEWRRLLDVITDLHAQHGIRWIVSNSRRTPAAVSDEIARRGGDAGGPIACFIDVRAQGPGSLQQFFTQAEVVVCTANSSSMITEAVWLRRPAIAVAPLQWRLRRRRRLVSQSSGRPRLGALDPDRGAVAATAVGCAPGDPAAGLQFSRSSGRQHQGVHPGAWGVVVGLPPQAGVLRWVRQQRIVSTTWTE